MSVTARPSGAPVEGALSDLERRVVEEVERRRDDLVSLTSDLIAFDTTTRATIHDGPRDEAALQAYLAGRLGAVGAEVDLWEASADDVAGSRQVPAGIGFVGYPQMVARLRGSGGGRSLLLNGHIDVVSPEPVAQWSGHPFRAWVREGNLHGRGSCDMKGGIASIVLAAEVLAGLGTGLAGDLLVATTTDEESTSAGGVAVVARGVRADAAIVAEPTSLRVGIANRGSLMPTITVTGRSAHAGALQPHWQEGGGVSATEKMALVIEAVRRLRWEWRDAPDHRHPHLPPGDIVATTLSGGDWDVSYPASCRLTCHLSYLPEHADADGYGTLVEAAFERWLHQIAQTDPWLREHPPNVAWSVDVPPAQVSAHEPVVQSLLAAGSQLAWPIGVYGTDYWNDGATFTRSGTPSVAFGPGSVVAAHTVDEFVPVDELVTHAKAVALAALRFCGAA